MTTFSLAAITAALLLSMVMGTSTLSRGTSCLHADLPCEPGTICAGTESDRKCVRPMQGGQRCGADPFWVCAAGFTCMNTKCRRVEIGPGEDCLRKGSHCIDGSVCVGSADRKICAMPRTFGKSCGQGDFDVCADGLNCADGVCRIPDIPLGGMCHRPGSVCAKGTVCAGKNRGKKCVEPLPVGADCSAEVSACVLGTTCEGIESLKKCVKPGVEGEACGVNALVVCEVDLECEDYKCVKPRIPKGGNCKKEGSVCEEGTVCIGHKFKRTCVVPGGMGNSCGRNRFEVCEDHLVCVDRECKKPFVSVGGNCLPDVSICVDGARCAGNNFEKKCVVPSKLGNECNVDELFSFCEDELVCEHAMCKKPKIPVGGDCILEVSQCVEGSHCVGTKTRKTCVIPSAIGSPCKIQDPFTLCEADLACMNEKCSKPVVPEGGNCSTERSVCIRDTVCVGSGHEKKCVIPGGIGEECSTDGPFSICEDGLVCDKYVCKKSKVREGGDCLPEGSVCAGGAECVGNNTNKMCIFPIPVGGLCSVSNPFSVCADSLKCIDKICSKPLIPERGDCTGSEGECVTGTVCVGDHTRKLCMTPKGAGKRCGTDPYWVCEHSLLCEGNICRYPVVPQNGNCLPEGSVCVEGTVCAGTSSLKLCVTPMSIGKPCGRDPYWVCETGATCRNHRCVGAGGEEGDFCGSSRPCSSDLYCGNSSWGRSRRCVMPAPEGYRCGRSRICGGGLRCRYGRCRRSIHRHW